MSAVKENGQTKRELGRCAAILETFNDVPHEAWCLYGYSPMAYFSQMPQYKNFLREYRQKIQHAFFKTAT